MYIVHERLENIKLGIFIEFGNKNYMYSQWNKSPMHLSS